MPRLLGVVGLIFAAGILVSVNTPPAPRPVAQAASSATLAPSPALYEPRASPAPSEGPAFSGRDIEGAQIEIPRLGIALPLAWGDVVRDVPRDGYAGSTPEGVALVFPGSSLPGAGGNTYIYAHARTGMFLALWNVRPGDVVVIRWPDAELRYSVERVVPRVDATDTSWLEATGPERLTLQTSTGPRASDPRFVAVAGRLEGSR